jgi:hypothetical protein
MNKININNVVKAGNKTKMKSGLKLYTIAVIS